MFTNQSCGGFTLVEALVATAISSILMMILASFSFVSARNCAALANYSELETQSRMTLDRITQQIRQSRALLSCSATNLVFKDADGASFELDYNPSAKTFSRSKGGVT